MDTTKKWFIVGAGPAGLTLATLLAKNTKDTIILIEREGSIGGCHRVIREDGYLTEHSPKIYLTNYKQFKMILEEVGVNFDDSFTPYIQSTMKAIFTLAPTLSISDSVNIIKEYITYIFSPSTTGEMTVYDMAIKYKFSDETTDTLNRLCELVQSSMHQLSLLSFFELINKSFFYTPLQPKQPFDKGIMLKWEGWLNENKVIIKLNETVTGVERNGIFTNKQKYSFTKNDNVVFTCPLVTLSNLLTQSRTAKNAFGPVELLNNFTEKTKYHTYIPVIFHWHAPIKVTNTWGYPKSKWGLISIVLTEYMKLEESGLAISTVVSLSNIKGSNNLTANETVDKDELIAEVFKQLKETYPTLPKYDKAIISKTTFHNNKIWVTTDSSFTLTPLGYFPYQTSPVFKNIHTVGPHTGKSTFNYTILETAVQNAVNFAKDKGIIEPNKYNYTIFTLNDLLLLICIIILFINFWLFLR